MRLLNGERRASIRRILDALLVVGGSVALAGLVLVVGWPLDTAAHAQLLVVTRAIIALFVVQEIVRIAIHEHPLRYVRRHWIEASLALLAGLELLFGARFVGWLRGVVPGLSSGDLTLLYLAATQVTALGMLGLRFVRASRWLGERRLAPGLILLSSFGGLVAAGTLLLKTPQATTEGIRWIDALFTATSAVCVTGLTVLDTGTAFTREGQWILLGLVQVGGLGVMTLTYFFAHFFAGGVSLRDRVLLQDFLSEENLGQIGQVLALIVAFTLGFEALGAWLIYGSLGVNGPDDPAFFALFHAISAFCNAGFSTLSAGLADPRTSENFALLTWIMLLVTIGGLGFPVLKNLYAALAVGVRRHLLRRRELPVRLTTNSRLVLLTSALLTFGGALLLWLTESPAPGQGVVREAFTALFHSVIARTAGFNMSPVEALLPASVVVMVFLMFVGGSPASTAGGIKTTTLAVAALSVRQIVRGQGEIEAYGRRLGRDIAYRALAVVLLAVGWTTVVVTALAWLHPEFALADLVFEAVSALSTVGLTRALTPQLGDPARVLLIVTMLVGRVGVLMVLFAVVRRREPTPLRLPEATVIIT